MYLLNDIIVFSKEMKILFTIHLPPFILLGLLFIILFPYFFITGEGRVHNPWLQLVAYPALVTNVLLSHMVLQKYLGAKKNFITWTIEFFVSVLIIYLVLY
ncbi:MAG TPA: hypothetical protein VFW07_20180 [Parafilimonas sp.]|nr:hypothetical protein [Parafilimonas sp.]